MYIKMKILICDDNEIYINKIEGIVNKWGCERNEEVFVHKTKSSNDALKWAEFNDYQVALLDIEMPDMDGIELASRLKSISDGVFVMFVTNYMDYAYDAFELEAYTYIKKDKMEQQLVEQLDRVKKDIAGGVILFEYKVRKTTNYVDVNNIKYFEVTAHKMLMCVEKSGVEEKIVFRDTISNVLSKLPEDMFMKVNRGTIINFKYVYDIRKESVMLRKNIEILISEGHRDEIRKKRLKFHIK